MFVHLNVLIIYPGFSPFYFTIWIMLNIRQYWEPPSVIPTYIYKKVTLVSVKKIIVAYILHPSILFCIPFFPLSPLCSCCWGLLALVDHIRLTLCNNLGHVAYLNHSGTQTTRFTTTGPSLSNSSMIRTRLLFNPHTPSTNSWIEFEYDNFQDNSNHCIF